jgi:hypothetical protein
MAVADRPPAYLLASGKQFQAVESYRPQQAPWPVGLETDAKIRAFVSSLWDETFEAQRPEHQRMNRAELFYSGHPYDNPRDNKEMPYTNFPKAIVETIWAEMTAEKPRPEIVSGYGVTSAQADQLFEVSRWMMNLTAFDQVRRLSVLEKLKLGWSTRLLTFDMKTGMPFPKMWNNWDFYPDPTATGIDNMMHCFLAGPVSTTWLRGQYPEKAHLIQPDNWVSPSYDVLVRPYRDMYSGGRGDGYAPRMGTLSAGGRSSGSDASYQTGEATPVGTQYLSTPTGAGQRDGPARTTFLLQLFIRDLSTIQTTHLGQLHDPDTGTWHWNYMSVPEMVCGSGWRVIQMTAGGVVLDVAALDDCYVGLPIVLGRNMRQGFRMFCPGEIDAIITPTRSYARRGSLLDLALDFRARPVVLVDKNSGIDTNRTPIVPGGVLRRNPGTNVDVLDVAAPVEAEFAAQDRIVQDINHVSGVEDSMRGNREPGVRTGIAIQRLQQASGRRVQAKERPTGEEDAELLKKSMVCLAKKLNRRMLFRGTKGQTVTIDPEVLMAEYDITFAEGTGTVTSRAARAAEALELYQLQVIDREAVLNVLEVPDRAAIAQRMFMADQQRMMVEAQAKAEGGGDQPPGGKK